MSISSQGEPSQLEVLDRACTWYVIHIVCRATDRRPDRRRMLFSATVVVGTAVVAAGSRLSHGMIFWRSPEATSSPSLHGEHVDFLCGAQLVTIFGFGVGK